MDYLEGITAILLSVPSSPSFVISLVLFVNVTCVELPKGPDQKSLCLLLVPPLKHV